VTHLLVLIRAQILSIQRCNLSPSLTNQLGIDLTVGNSRVLSKRRCGQETGRILIRVLLPCLEYHILPSILRDNPTVHLSFCVQDSVTHICTRTT
jgi:hypothetical protein